MKETEAACPAFPPASRSYLSQANSESTGLRDPSENPPDDTNSLLHQSIFQVTRGRMARKVRFYRNGDRFYAGLLFAVSEGRYPTLDSLMADLTTSPMCDRRILSKGVRCIFTIDGSRVITSVGQLKQGCGYVCSSTPTFRRTDYPKSSFPSWNLNQGSVFHLTGGGHLSSRSTRSTAFVPTSTTQAPMMTSSSPEPEVDGDRKFVHPRLVSVIRKGRKPRRCYRLLLNRRTAHTLHQVLADVTKLVKPDFGNVRRMYSISGKQVTHLRDFFGDDNVFLAYCNEKKPSPEDFELCDKELQELSFGRSSSVRRLSLVNRQTNSSSFSSTTKISRRRTTSARSLLRDNSESGCEMESGEGLGRLPLSLRQSKKRSFPSSNATQLQKTPTNIRPIHHVTRRIDSRLSTRDQPKEPKQLRIKYRIGHVIGEGNFAIVKECTEKARRLPFALKIVNKAKCRGREKMIDNEVSILRKIKHPNIVQLIDEFHSTDTLFLVMELVTGGDLLDSIASATKYSERDASGMTFHLASAVSYLHSLNIVHRDIKLENLLVHERGDGFKALKLGDFGLATEVKEPLFTVCGTPTYIAPEILAETGYGLKVDLWSVGVILYILLCGFPPFSSETNDSEELFNKIQSGKFEFLDPFWNNISDAAKNLIGRLLKVNVDERPSADELLHFPWVADDVAKDNNIHSSVASRLVQFAKSERIIQGKETSKEQPRVSVIATTALDKGCKYFPRRKFAYLTTINRQRYGGEGQEHASP